jgi:hypothetical protein
MSIQVRPLNMKTCHTLASRALPAFRTTLTAVLLSLSASLSFSAEPGSLTYKELVKSPEAAKSDREFKAYLLGIGYAILMDHVCSFSDEDKLKNPNAVIDELIAFAKSTWGRLYLEGTKGLGGLHYDMSAGNALYKIFTEHSRCIPLNRKKEQLER